MSDPVSYLDGRVVLHAGDCFDVLRRMPAGSIDSVVTDPPYALVSIARRFGKAGTAAPRVPDGGSGVYARASAGFMGQAWDTGERAFAVEFWAEVLRVLKPGGHVVAFAGTRTFHRLVCAIEDVGFEIRDQLAWMYGSGFPKSHDVAKGIDRHNGDERPVVASEKVRDIRNGNGRGLGDGLHASSREGPVYMQRDVTTAASAAWQGWGTALKPAWEPICLARKPLSGSVAENVLRHRTGGLNIDGCRVEGDGNKTFDRTAGGRPRDQYRTGTIVPGSCKPSSLGRWPANVVHDGSDEVVGAFPASKGQQGDVRGTEASRPFGGPIYGEMSGRYAAAKRGDAGSAARFFYSAKADAHDRIGSKHPTVKPVDLMQWLVRLVTPPGGTVLDPFAGTGTTGEAAFREGFRAVLVEREDEYRADIARRMRLALAGRGQRSREAAKARGTPPDLGPLFGDPGLPGGGGGRRIYGRFRDQDARDGRSGRSASSDDGLT